MRYSVFTILLGFIFFISCSEKNTEANVQKVSADSSQVLNSEETKSDDSLCACEVQVYLNDPDTGGTNVRNRAKGEVIRKLYYDKDCLCLTVKIRSAANNWLELEEGGWVFAPLFAIGSRNYAEGEIVYLNEFPSDESNTVAEYKKEQEFKVLSCRDTWLYVEAKDKKRGWLKYDMQCPSAVTTCP